MERFSQLYEHLDATRSTNQKVAAIKAYFQDAPADDIAWAVYILTGKRLKRLVQRPLLKAAVQRLTGYSLWMIDECYHTVGDFAETVSLLADSQGQPSSTEYQDLTTLTLSQWMNDTIQPLRTLDDEAKIQRLCKWWQCLDRKKCFVATKLMTGGLRVGVSQTLVARALAEFSDVPRDIILHRLMGDWTPTEDFYQRLIHPETASDNLTQPFPFYLASPLDKPVEELGDRSDWLLEWKWDGIRAQLIHRDGVQSLWSRGGDVITEQFPELIDAISPFDQSIVFDGEIVAWDRESVQPFFKLQKRLGRKSVPPRFASNNPVRFCIYDVLEYQNQDWRKQALQTRRDTLQKIVEELDTNLFFISPEIEETQWDRLKQLREESRSRGVEGMMLKHRQSHYGAGRKKGDWWKWKVDPFTVDAVLLYAQAGSGRRATLFTDYTFAVWDSDQLIPVAKAYSGLSDKEINELNRWIRAHTKERFGPVRSVEAHHVFELAFEAINPSKRHKSGVALRFPRIARWRQDKTVEQANTLTDLKELLDVYASA